MSDSESTSPDWERQKVQYLLEELESECRNRKPKLSGVSIIPVGCLTLYLGTLPCSWAWYRNSILGLMFTIVELLFLVAVLPRLRVTRRQQYLANALLNYEDVRVVGPLVSALYWPDMDESRDTIRQTLMHLLPKLKVSDTGIFTPPQRACLTRSLGEDDIPFVEAVLKALEQIGDSRDLRAVRKLARGYSWNPRRRDLREAAWECLFTLEARLQPSGDTFLRVPAESDSALLRPSAGVNETGTDQLLRPDQNPPDEGSH